MLQMKLAFLLALLLVARADDPCATFFGHSDLALSGLSATRLDRDGAEQDAFKCLNSIVSLTDEEAKSTLDTVKSFTELYGFVDDLKNPPQSIQQEGVDTAVDIKAMLDKIGTENVNAFKFYTEIENVFALARDAHTSFQVPCLYNSIRILTPISFCPDIGGEGDLIIKTCPQQSDYLRQLGINIEKGVKVTSINGVDAVKYFDDFADHHFLTGRDHAQRFEYLMGTHTTLHVRALLEVTDTGLNYEKFQYTALDVKLEGSEESVKVPLLLMAPNSGSHADIARYCTDASANGESPNDLYVDFLRQAFPAENMDIFSLPNADVPLVPDFEIDPTEALAQADFDKHSDLRMASRVVNNDQYFAFYQSLNECTVIVLSFYTLDPSTWIQQFANVMLMAKENGCGVVTGTKDGKVLGKRLTFDLRVNGGGLLALLDIMTSVAFPDYTPHHFTVTTKRLSSKSDDLVTKMAQLEGPDVPNPYREPYTFKPLKQCGGKYTYGCKDWKSDPITRKFGDATQEYSVQFVDGPFYWEAPSLHNIFKYARWTKQANVLKRYGFQTGAIAQTRFLMDVLDIKLSPELTNFVFGFGSASASAQFATRALSYRLGSVMRTGYVKHTPLQAAMVPGGNVIQYSSLKGKVEMLPNNADLAITTQVSLPSTHETATIVDANTPMEFVKLPPQYVIQLWQQSSTMYSQTSLEQFFKSINDVLPRGNCVRGLHSRHFADGCNLSDFPGADSVGRLCDETKGTYTGECGVVICKFGYELVEGKCVDNKLVIPGVLRLSISAIAAVLIIFIAVVIVITTAIVVPVVICSKHRKSKYTAIN